MSPQESWTEARERSGFRDDGGSFLKERAEVKSATCFALLIGSVWVFHGLYSKLLDGIPRHRAIVRRILGERVAGGATRIIGALEILLGLWAISGTERVLCASVQTLAIITMNALEIRLARDLLISAAGMVALNGAFLALVWWWALGFPA